MPSMLVECDRAVLLMVKNPLQLLYRDADLLVVHKPSGLLVHRSPIDRHETEFALQYARELNGGEHVYPVHRLDKPTSGLLVFARSAEVASALGQLMMTRQVQKTYLAVVRGWPQDAGSIDYPLRLEPADKRDTSEQPVQSAVSDYTCLARVELPVQVDRYPQTRYALVAVHPYEGRKHQVRRHLKQLDHPILGDIKHGKGPHNRYAESEFGRGLLLACVQMTFPHPDSGEPLTLNAPLEPRFAEVIRRWNWQQSLPMEWLQST
ncbi:pseudouridine synthase [Marinospirillum alkaliphilum]|uniref:tRNA pseudouridine synthase C n=1 Tax=Marinospirillum alkaliphilum DSM 21637 TaxID=1122209 RepID=A0A1K1WMK2_9GAMM|nr:pseudouridine synthase [Marinospirillum alkaliphilum]SFX38593.1 tRNA pseudouridine synthase C [Marinospirillum alkaliphilum DSM 21637]